MTLRCTNVVTSVVESCARGCRELAMQAICLHCFHCLMRCTLPLHMGSIWQRYAYDAGLVQRWKRHLSFPALLTNRHQASPPSKQCLRSSSPAKHLQPNPTMIVPSTCRNSSLQDGTHGECSLVRLQPLMPPCKQLQLRQTKSCEPAVGFGSCQQFDTVLTQTRGTKSLVFLYVVRIF